MRVILASEFKFSTNYNETVKSLIRLKKATLPTKIKIDYRRKKKSVLIDMTSVKSISVAGALVLAAEIDRWRRLDSIPLKPVYLEDWDEEVKSLLHSLGFFKLLKSNSAELKDLDSNKDNIGILELRPYSEFDGEKVWSVIEDIMVNHSSSIIKNPGNIYEALFEALDNSRRHAYPIGHDFEFQHISEWWCAACWIPKNKEFQFLVYDQGIGIPDSLPRSGIAEHVLKYLSSVNKIGATFKLEQKIADESTMIEAAIRVSGNSVVSGRGKGLRDIVAPVYQYEGSRVRILSGRGSYTIHHDKRVEKVDHIHHIGGTLIEWTIPIK